MTLRHKILFLSLIVLLSLGSVNPSPALAQAGGQIARIGVRQVDGVGEFYNRATGDRFVPRGSNYIDFKEVIPGKLWEDYIFGAGTYRPEKVRAEFAKLAEYGYNTVRLFFDHCYSGPSCIGRSNGDGLNPVFLDHMVEVMNIAADEGLYLILTANGVPLDGNYYGRFERQFNADPGGFPSFYANGYYLHAAGVAMQEQYWRDLMSGLVERGAPFDVVLAWELQNEYFLILTDPPFTFRSGLITTANGQTYDMADPQQKHQMVDDNVVYWSERLSTIVHEYDPDGLITLGFFPSIYPNPLDLVPDWYRDAAAVIDRAPVDFWDFHIYPDMGQMHILTENLGMHNYTAKPVLMGEVGANRAFYSTEDVAVNRMQEWMVKSCNFGFDGWLVWEHNSRPGNDDFWNMVANDDMMLKALAPVNWSDPCSSPPPKVEIANLALLRPVTVSAYYPDLPGAGATDGSLDREWTAGTHGAQWIEIDLQQPRSINRLVLYVAQDPPGDTQHVVWAIRSDGTRVLLANLRGYTGGSTVLEVTLPGVVADVTRIRVETPVSPTWVGWREIEVYGDQERSGDACLLSAPGAVNLRGGAGTEFDVVDRLSAGSVAAADGVVDGADGFRWYHVSGDLWVREDVVRASPTCQGLTPLLDVTS